MRILFSLIVLTLLGAPGATGQEAPKLVVGIVVDQMRYDYIERFRNDFGADGFNRLVREGFSYENTDYNYIPTLTAPGHASIYTGATPSQHGIIGNEWFDRQSGRLVTNVTDTTARIVGSVVENPYGRSPGRLLRPTLSDQWRHLTDYKAKVISVSLKDRGAILPGGRLANAAYWYDWQTSPGHFVSSSHYMEKLPRWVEKFNKQEQADAYLSQTWEPLLPMEAYDESAPDDNPHENLIGGKQRPVFPYDFESMRGRYEGSTEFYQLLWATPFANTLLKDFALEALESEKLGKDAITDFFCISFSTPDVAGHTFGPQSVELQDIYLRLDREIADLLNALDQQVGRENYVLFLTSDHGTYPVVSYALKQGMPAGLIVLPRIQQDLSFAMSLEFGALDWISHIGTHEIYLNRDLIAQEGNSLEAMQQWVADFMTEQPGIRHALTAETLRTKTFDSGLPAMLQKGFNPARSGDVLLAYEEGFVATYDFRTPLEAVRGASHGSGYVYDTHVPLIWLGEGIPQGNTDRQVHIVDIVPTIRKMLGMPAGEQESGKALEELWKD